jgi:fructose-specific PTS system IIA component
MLNKLKKVNEEGFQVCSEHLKKIKENNQVLEGDLL